MAQVANVQLLTKEREYISTLQYRHLYFPLVFQPDKLPYAGKSCVVQTRATCKLKVSSFNALYASAPHSHCSLSSLIKSFEKASMPFPGDFGLG